MPASINILHARTHQYLACMHEHFASTHAHTLQTLMNFPILVKCSWPGTVGPPLLEHTTFISSINPSPVVTLRAHLTHVSPSLTPSLNLSWPMTCHSSYKEILDYFIESLGQPVPQLNEYWIITGLGHFLHLNTVRILQRAISSLQSKLNQCVWPIIRMNSKKNTEEGSWKYLV